MRILAIHDRGGELAGLMIGPADESMPAASVSAPGYLVSEVEAPDLPHDLQEAANQRRVLEILQHSRVEVAPKARLVGRDAGHRSQ